MPPAFCGQDSGWGVVTILLSPQQLRRVKIFSTGNIWERFYSIPRGEEIELTPGECSGLHSLLELQEAVHPRSSSQWCNWTCNCVFKIICILLPKIQMLNLRYLLRLPLRSMKKQDRGLPHPQIVTTHILWPISTIFKAPN